MGKLVEQIQSLGYHFIEGRTLLSVPMGKDGFKEIRLLSVRSLDGQSMTIKPEDSPTMFPGGSAFREGIMDNSLLGGIKTTCIAIYQDYFNLDDNGYSMLLYNYSNRTKMYFDAEKTRIGLIDYKEGMPEQFFALDKYMIGQGIGEMDVGLYADGRYVVQSTQALFEEDYVLRMHYTRFPGKQDVEDAVTIRKLERDFKLGRHREMFFCDECGNPRHWLDIEGTIQHKLQMRLKHKCGCAGEGK